jgi:hypothetical protein
VAQIAAICTLPQLGSEQNRHRHFQFGHREGYLRWLAKHEQEVGENPPLGIILCAGKKQEQIELLELDNAGIHVAEYLTRLPSKAVLKQRLHQAILNARLRLENKSE